MKELFIEGLGEEQGTKVFERCIESSQMSEEEIEAHNKAIVENNPLLGIAAHVVVNMLLGAKDSPCNVEEDGNGKETN